MPKKLTEGEVKHWKGRLDIASHVLKSREKRWKSVLDRYVNRNLMPLGGSEDRELDSVSVNMVFSNIRTKIPFLYIRDPDIVVRAKRREVPGDRIRVVDGTMRYWMGEWDMKGHTTRAILDAKLKGYGILKLGYTTRTRGSVENPPRHDSIKDKVVGMLPGQKKSRKDTGVDLGIPEIYQEGPTYGRISPKLFLTHPDARFPLDEGARWAGQMSVKTMTELKYNTLFDKSWRRDLKPSRTLSPDTFDLPPNYDPEKNDDPDQQFVVLYEVWDRLTREVLVFAEGNWDLGAGRIMAWPFDGMEGFPFELLVPFEVPDEFEALTEEDPVITQLEELDRLRTMQIRHLKRLNRKYTVTADVPPSEKRALEIGHDGLVITVEGETAVGKIVPIADVPFSFDFHKAIADTKEDLVTISAVAQFDQGRIAGAKTATEAQIIGEASQARAVFEQQQVLDWVERSLRKSFQIMQQMLPKDLVVRIVGDAAGSAWRKISPKDIAGDYDIRIVPGSTAPPNSSLMRANAMRLFELWANSPFVEQRELHLMLAEQFPDLMQAGRLDRIIKNPDIADESEALPQIGEGLAQSPEGLSAVPGGF